MRQSGGRPRGLISLGVALVAAKHQAAFLRAHIDIGVDDPGDGLVRPDIGRRLADHPLVAHRHELDGGAAEGGDAPQPCPSLTQPLCELSCENCCNCRFDSKSSIEGGYYTLPKPSRSQL